VLLPACCLSEADVLVLASDPNLNRLNIPTQMRPHLQQMREMNRYIIHTLVSCSRRLLDEDIMKLVLFQHYDCVVLFFSL
jgi:hypothetical protein